MRKQLFLALLSSLLVVGCGGGGDAELKGFLPSSAEVPGIKADGGTRVYEGKELFDYMDGGAELFYEYHFEQACVQRYQTSQGEVTVEIYYMNLPANAYGIYTFDTQGEHPLVGQDATYEKGLLTFWEGKYFVRVFSENEGLKETLLALGRAVAKKMPQGGERPEILHSLPSQGMVQDSLLYFRDMIALNNAYFLSHQNVLAMGQGAAGVTFKYTLDGQTLRVIMVRYPGRPQAEEAIQSLAASEVIKEGTLKDGAVLGKSRRGFGGAKVSQDILILILDGRDPRHITRALKVLAHKGGKQ